MSRLHRMLMMSARKEKPTPPDKLLYERILAQMDNDMPGLRDSLVCWYDPRLQGLTNEQLADNYPTYVNGLRDLSGNGRHMTLYGMKGTSGNGMIDADGNLVFDGIDDYALLNNSALDAYTYLWNLPTINYQPNSMAFISNRANVQCVQNAIHIFLNGNPRGICKKGIGSFDSDGRINKIFVSSEKNNYAIDTTSIGARVFNAPADRFASITLSSFLTFNRALELTEYEYVTDNLIIAHKEEIP